MQKKDVAKFYKQQQVNTITPGELIILLYDGAIEHLNRAEMVFSDSTPKRIESFHNSLISCQNIITELTVSLDMKSGGEIASNLFRLYDYMHHRLVDANVEKDVVAVQEVKKLLAQLKNAWINAEQQASQSKQKPGMNLSEKGKGLDAQA